MKEIISISDANITISDGNYSSKYPRYEEFVSSGIPFIRANNFDKFTIIDEEMYYITKQKHEELKKGHLKQGDILFVSRGNVGQLAIVPQKYDNANINAQIVLFRVNNDEWYNRYLLWNLNSTSVKKQIFKLVTGTTLKQMPVNKIKNIFIVKREISEQYRIAKVLDIIQNIIDLRKKELKELSNIIDVKFNELYFKDYCTERLGIVCDVRDGTHDSPKYVEKSDYFLITSKNISTGKIDLSEVKYISKKDFDFINKRSLVEKNDIIMPMIGTIGGPIIIQDEFINYAIKNVALIKSNDKFLSEFMLNALKSKEFVKYLKNNSRGGTQKFVSLSDIRNFDIKLVPIEEQTNFCELVRKIRKQEEIITKNLDDMNLLLKAKMQEYFD